MDWREGEVRELGLDEFDQRFARYRLQVDESTRQAMIASLRRFGQLSPVVVCELGGSLALVDGFKRHQAAGETKGMDGLSARRIEADESSAKAAIYSLNVSIRPTRLARLVKAISLSALAQTVAAVSAIASIFMPLTGGIGSQTLVLTGWTNTYV